MGRGKKKRGKERRGEKEQGHKNHKKLEERKQKKVRKASNTEWSRKGDGVGWGKTKKKRERRNNVIYQFTCLSIYLSSISI